MNYIDLFSGIGGFALGAYWAGMRFENHFFSDIEKYAVELYQKRFPEAIPLGDIKKIDTKKMIMEYGDEWVLTGGFPCQDISIAGKGAGIEGERSGLWFEYWRLIRDLRPRVAIMENVGALTFRGLDAVLGSLAEIWYNAEWQDIRAEDVGAPHRRERIWIIAYPNSTGSGTRRSEIDESWSEKKQERRDKPQSQFSRHGETLFSDTTGDTEGRDKSRIRRQSGRESEIIRGDTNKEISNTSFERGECRATRKPRKFAQCGEGIFGRSGAREIPNPDSIGRIHTQTEIKTTKTGEHAQCNTSTKSRNVREEPSWYPTDWATEPAVGRLANGIPHRMDRLKGLGNAIVPQIAMILWCQIRDNLSGFQFKE